MITIEQTSNLLNVAVLGEFTLADFKLFEEQVLPGVQWLQQKAKEEKPTAA